jgi:hypothetical protein
MPLLILAGLTFLGLGTAGMTFGGLSLLVDVGRRLVRRRPTRPTFWYDAVPTEKEEALVYSRKRQGGNGL